MLTDGSMIPALAPLMISSSRSAVGRFLGLSIAVAAGVAGCSTLDQIKYKPTVDLQSIGLQETSLSSGTVLVRLGVSNPNPVSVNLDELRYDLNMNGRDLAEGVVAQGIRLDANETTTVEVPVRFQYLEVFNSVSDMVRSGSTTYELTGGVTAGPFEIPYGFDGRVDLPSISQITGR